MPESIQLLTVADLDSLSARMERIEHLLLQSLEAKPEKEHLTPEEAMQHLSVGKTKFYQLAKGLKPRLIGGSKRYLKSDLEKLIV